MYSRCQVIAPRLPLLKARFFSHYISMFLPIQVRRRESKNQNTGGVLLKKREHIVLKLSSVPLSEVGCLD